MWPAERTSNFESNQPKRQRKVTSTMHTFIDVAGASGMTYRFYKVHDTLKLPAIAGNFVYVRGDAPNSVVVCCGTDETLLNAATRWNTAQHVHNAQAIYVRRNVSWKVRASEHDDIVQRHRPPLIAAAEMDRQILG